MIEVKLTGVAPAAISFAFWSYTYEAYAGM